jgi:hypothetical protein
MSDQHEPTNARQRTQRKPEQVLEHVPDAGNSAEEEGRWYDQLRPETRTRLRNLSLAAIAGMAGCVTLIVVLTALLIGLWIDSRFDQRGPFTFALLCLSVPVSLFLMLRLTITALNRIQVQPVRTRRRSSTSEEE